MINEDLIADLKQFITAAVSQAMSGVATKDDLTVVRTEIKALKARVDAGFAEQKLTFHTTFQALGEQLEGYEKQLHQHDAAIQDHGDRLHDLEQKLA